MKILKNLFKVVVALVVGIETAVIIFFGGFIAGINFKDDSAKKRVRYTPYRNSYSYVDYSDGKRRSYQ